QFTPSADWSNQSGAAAPVVTTTVNDGRLVVQSSLLGQGAEFATAQDLSIGQLQVPTSGPGTVTATIASADFCQEGLAQPVGADLGIAFGGTSATVDVQPQTVGLLGDVNDNGRLDIFDALFIQQHIQNLRPELPRADLA